MFVKLKTACILNIESGYGISWEDFRLLGLKSSAPHCISSGQKYKLCYSHICSVIKAHCASRWVTRNLLNNCVFQDVLRNSDHEIDWIFKLSFAYDIVNVRIT